MVYCIVQYVNIETCLDQNLVQIPTIKIFAFLQKYHFSLIFFFFFSFFFSSLPFFSSSSTSLFLSLFPQSPSDRRVHRSRWERKGQSPAAQSSAQSSSLRLCHEHQLHELCARDVLRRVVFGRDVLLHHCSDNHLHLHRAPVLFRRVQLPAHIVLCAVFNGGLYLH